MKMKHGIIKVFACAVIVCLAAGAGYMAGTGQIGPSKGNIEKDSQKEEPGKLIAIVNLDKGVEQGKEKIQYSSQLLPYTGVEYTVTGLEDARNGVKTGLYSAYVIIPEEFSGTVNSINQNPVKSVLPYALSTKLNAKGREQAIRDIQDIGTALNDSLTKIYVASILEEFHGAQDASDLIMANDVKDTEQLDAVNAGDMLSMVEIPQLVQVENNVPPLDLSEQFTNGSSLVGDIGDAYQAFLEKGQQDLDVSKASSNEVNSKINETSEKLATANNSLKDMTITDEAQDGDTETPTDEYNAEIQKIQAAVTNYENYIARCNNQIEQMNTTQSGLITSLKDYENAESQYQAALAETIHEEGGISRYRVYSQEDVTNIMAAAAASLKNGIGDANLPAGYSDWLTYLMAGINYADYYGEYPLIGDIDKGTEDNTAPHLYPQLSPVLNLESKKNDATDDRTDEAAENIKTVLEGSGLINIADARRQKMLDDFQNKKAALITAYDEASAAHTETKEKDEALNSEINAYDLPSYIDNEKISGLSDSLLKNNQEVQSKTAEHTSGNEQYVAEVYKSTGEYITSMHKSVADAQEKSENLLEDGLAAAKSSRAENNETNLLLLEELAEKLPYTRLGKLENVELYEFITAPLAMDEQRNIEGETEAAAKVQKKDGYSWHMVILILIIAAVFITGIRFAVKRKRRFEPLYI